MSSTIRTDGAPSGVAVASAIAFASFGSLARASAKLTDGELTFRLPARPPSDHPDLAIECRAISPHDAEELFVKDAARADAAIRSRASLEDASRATSDLAALVGWDDPRVKRRVRALDGLAPDGGAR